MKDLTQSYIIEVPTLSLSQSASLFSQNDWKNYLIDVNQHKLQVAANL